MFKAWLPPIWPELYVELRVQRGYGRDRVTDPLESREKEPMGLTVDNVR